MTNKILRLKYVHHLIRGFVDIVLDNQLLLYLLFNKCIYQQLLKDYEVVIYQIS